MAPPDVPAKRLRARKSTDPASQSTDTAPARPKKPTKRNGKRAEAVTTTRQNNDQLNSTPEEVIVDDTASQEQQQQPQQQATTSPAVNSEENVFVSSAISSLLVNAFEKVLTSVRDASSNQSRLQMFNRMTAARKLPYFSGNPLEWMHFKEVFNLTTEMGAYSDVENSARLHEALTGEAREIVGTALATNRDPQAVMRTLELHYGNKNLLAHKIESEILQLPRIDSKKLSLIQFATKLQNGIASFKSYNLTGYLHNLNLIRSVGNKMPDALKYAYAHYNPGEIEENISELEKMSKFLCAEAELTSKSVIFDAELMRSSNEPRANEKKHDSYRRKTGVYSVEGAARKDERPRKTSKKFEKCLICKNGRHLHEDCPKFTRELKENRHCLVTRSDLCYGCLKHDHFARNCRATGRCSKCNGVHHYMLPHVSLSDGQRIREKPNSNDKTANISAVGRTNNSNADK